MKPTHTLNIVRVKRGKTAGQWRWNVTARNGEIVAQGESYKRVQALVRTLRNLFEGDVIPAQLDAWEEAYKARTL